MRVISGRFKGHRLKNFQADHIRPTTDRVKETLFNKLMNHIDGARVLDLFSGTGNLGIEAISRGASHVDLVESHRKSLSIIRENLLGLKVTEGFKVIPLDVFKYVRDYQGKPYDVILADPPFTQQLADDVMKALAASQTFHGETLIIIEASSRETCLDRYPPLILLDRREFGDKHLNFFQMEKV